MIAKMLTTIMERKIDRSANSFINFKNFIPQIDIKKHVSDTLRNYLKPGLGSTNQASATPPYATT
jgi:hypothetical protein